MISQNYYVLKIMQNCIPLHRQVNLNSEPINNNEVIMKYITLCKENRIKRNCLEHFYYREIKVYILKELYL